MIFEKTLKALEFDKILKAVSSYAVLETSKRVVIQTIPSIDIKSALYNLKLTEEGYKLLFTYSVGNVPFFKDISEQLSRADKGATLTMGELLEVASNLRSARVVKNAFSSVNDDSIVHLKEFAKNLFEFLPLEKDITSKIISEDTMADSASPKLSSIRKNIRSLNAKIRDKLNSYIRGSNIYLQDNVVTMRMNRYVIPVKSEYKGMVKGFVHDQSASGSTVFIEPEQVIEYNNELKTALLEEQNEIYRILQELTSSVVGVSKAIRYNAELLTDIDVSFAKAWYAFNTRSSMPLLNDDGVIDIKRGRHPLINPDTVVPVTVRLGKDFNILLVTGPNTGGKTVTLKLVGLFTLMATSGLYIPADDESSISVFDDVFCDIGDEQSIEQSLSTFSSHMRNVIYFCENLNKKPLILLDELGAGTDPEEGSALALAVIEKMLESGSRGIITTHYSRLKEYALSTDLIENASMDFDVKTLRPVYKLNIGIPGSSNAIEISKRLGLSDDLAKRAVELLSSDKVSFEKILKKAEESRQNAETLTLELEKLKKEKEEEVAKIKAERDAVQTEKQKITADAKKEVKRIVSERLIEAEAIVKQLEETYKLLELENGELIKARSLKNKLANSKYLEEEIPLSPYELKAVDINALSVGDKVYVKSFNCDAVVNSVDMRKKTIEVLIGSLKSNVKIGDVFNARKGEKVKTKVSRDVVRSAPKAEINILGKTVSEGVYEVEKFIDQAVVNNIEEIKIIHGTGTGKLKKGIWEYLKTNVRVAEFRQGRYGEGESGVTIVTLK